MESRAGLFSMVFNGKVDPLYNPSDYSFSTLDSQVSGLLVDQMEQVDVGRKFFDPNFNDLKRYCY